MSICAREVQLSFAHGCIVACVWFRIGGELHLLCEQTGVLLPVMVLSVVLQVQRTKVVFRVW